MENLSLHGIPRCLMLVVIYIKLARTSPHCSWTQITQVDGNVTTCWDCPKCPHGLGLTPQCASYITSHVPIQCVQCKDGVTYSHAYDVSSCKPCSICGHNQITIRRCSVTHNAICGKCKPGFYRAITEDCWPCTKCCPDSIPDDHEPLCLNQGLPAKLSCRLDFKTEACAKVTPTKPIAVTTKSTTHCSCESIVVNSTIVVEHYYYTTTSSHLWMAVGISMLVIFAVGIPVVLLTVWRPRCNHQSLTYLFDQEHGFDLQKPLSAV